MMMNPGYVYILTNDSIPGLVKIGRTSRDVEVRASELWQTGVPSKFEVYASEKTCDCVQLEAFMHADLNKVRVNTSREFFKIDPGDAQDRLRFWVEHQALMEAKDFIDQNFNAGVVAIPFRRYVPGDSIDRLVEEAKTDHWTITSAISLLTAEELAPAISRAHEKDRQEQIDDLKRIGIPESEWGGYF